MNTIQELIPLNNACEELISSKYILVDMKINTILSIIEKDNKIREIVSNCCETQDYSNLIKLSCIQTATDSKFILPSDEKSIICLVYNLLYQFSNKEIELYDFINEYYAEENTSDSFASFCKSVIIPFAQAISSLYERKYVLVNSNEYQDNYYNKIKMTIKSIYEKIDTLGLKLIQKDELCTMLNALYIASENCDKKMVFALMIGIEYYTKANKKVKSIYEQLENCFSN